MWQVSECYYVIRYNSQSWSVCKCEDDEGAGHVRFKECFHVNFGIWISCLSWIKDSSGLKNIIFSFVDAWRQTGMMYGIRFPKYGIFRNTVEQRLMIWNKGRHITQVRKWDLKLQPEAGGEPKQGREDDGGRVAGAQGVGGSAWGGGGNVRRPCLIFEAVWMSSLSAPVCNATLLLGFPFTEETHHVFWVNYPACSAVLHFCNCSFKPLTFNM